MAISGNHYRLLKEHAPLFKRGGALLEIGEANWYGDTEPTFLVCQPRLREHFQKLLDSTKPDPFEIAKAAYQSLFEPSIMHAVDLHGSDRPETFQQDLNRPLDLPQAYDLVVNNGTLEHVFNIAQAFQSIHNATLPGGYMIHDAPCLGWFDHGFYCLQPGLFFDLASANDYELVSLSICEIRSGSIIRVESREHLHSLTNIPINSLLFVVLRKKHARPFRCPMLGIYSSGGLSESGQKAWREKR